MLREEYLGRRIELLKCHIQVGTNPFNVVGAVKVRSLNISESDQSHNT